MLDFAEFAKLSADQCECPCQRAKREFAEIEKRATDLSQPFETSRLKLAWIRIFVVRIRQRQIGQRSQFARR